jgi:signal transduction histidine kinase
MKRFGASSLRLRVTLAYGLLGALLSLMFAGATTFISEDYEQVLVDGMLRTLAADLRDRHLAHPERPLSLPQTHLLKGFLSHADGSGQVPQLFAGLAPGIHEAELGEDIDLRVGVFELGHERLYLAIDLGDIENLETHFEQILFVILVAGTLIAAWLGWLFAGNTIAPVRRLAEAVEALPDHAEATQLARLTANDELGRLASAIDGYQGRLVQAEVREREFFADASHELRTPLSVVLGSAELLLDDEHIDDALRRRLQRLDRGAQTLADLLEGLLSLARGLLGEIEQVDTRAWLKEILGDIAAEADTRLSIDDDAAHLHLRPREAGLVVRGVVRRLLRSDSASGLEIAVKHDRIVITHATDTSRPSAPMPSDASGDLGLGATLSGRLAVKMGWSIDESCHAAGQVKIILPSLPA